MAKCVICGYEAKSLQPHLKHKHDMKVSEKLLYSLRTGEITTSAQQELLKLLMI